MRTSHVAIKRMVADEKNRLTDEQLFGSPQFAAYLTDIAEGATKRYRRSSKVSTYWDTSESADIAHTDNRIIRLNAGNFLTGSFPTKSLKADSLIGIVAHECGHILYSDFTMLATYQQALSAGRFYPATPEELTARQEKSLQEILESVEDKDAAVITAVSHISHALVNLMEDVYIEGRMCDAFPGTMKTGILLNNLRYAAEMETVTAEIDRQHHEVFILINLLIQYEKTGDINNLGGYKGPYLDVVYECIPYVDDAAYDDDAKARFDSAIFADLDAAQNYAESLKLHGLQYPESIVTFLVCNRQKTSLQPWYQREMEAIRLMEKTGQTYLDKSFCIFVKTHIENLKKLPTKEAA